MYMYLYIYIYICMLYVPCHAEPHVPCQLLLSWLGLCFETDIQLLSSIKINLWEWVKTSENSVFLGRNIH